LSIEELRDDPFHLPDREAPSASHATRIVVVHDDPILREGIRRNFTGYEVTSFTDPMLAWSALDRLEPIQLLITGFVFAGGTPHGIALARKARARQPTPRILFVAAATEDHLREETDGLGNFIEASAGVPTIVDTARRLLEADGSA
jgi:DNA-binding NtrC family response regulator